MSKVFIDTLFVIALVNQRDQYHQRASELAEKYDGHPLLTTDAVILEIGNALARNFKEQAVEIIEDFYASDEVEIIHLNPSLIERAFEHYKIYQDKQWGLVDCISFIVMR